MQRTILLILTLILNSTFILSALEPATPYPVENLTEKEKKKLENDKVILVIEELDNADILVKAFLLFNKTPVRSWEIMARSQEQTSYLKNIAELVVHPVSATEEHIEYVIKWFFIKKKFKLIHLYDKPNLYMSWDLDPNYENQLDAHTGYWQLYAYPGNRTLAEYADNMALEGLPRWLENLVKKEVVKRTMYDIKDYLDGLTE